MTKELNEIARFVIDLWGNNLYDDYVLYVDTHNIPGLPAGVIYGRGLILSKESSVQLPVPTINDTINYLLEATSGYVTKIALFNKEVFYYYKVECRNNELIISVNMSSMIYGKSMIHITDIKRIEENKWELVARGSHSRGKRNKGYIGSLQECLSCVIDEEERLGSPYEQIKYDFNEVLKKDLKVTVSEDGSISVNNWIGI